MFSLLALLIGTIVLALVAGIAKRLITAGVELLRPTLSELRRDV